MKIICPHCHHEIETDLRETYYSRHKEQLLEQYKERMKDPEFRKKRAEISLKSYHKNKQCQKKK